MAANRCSECDRPIGLVGPAWERWQHVPDEDDLLDARRHDGETPLRRRFVCSGVTPDNAYDSLPRVVDGYCYSPARHTLYAGTNATDWVLVADKIGVRA
jgi:hypothetical protein